MCIYIYIYMYVYVERENERSIHDTYSIHDI